MEQRLRCVKLGLGSLFLWSFSGFASSSEPLYVMAGDWDDVPGFVSLNQCASAPSKAGLPFCSPARLAYTLKLDFHAQSFFSANELVVKIADDVINKRVTASQVESLLISYRYSEVNASTRIAVLGPGFTVGVNPYKLSGQFHLHNPNLPLASLAVRQDTVFFAGAAYAYRFPSGSISVGAKPQFYLRQETVAEASIIDVSARPRSDWLTKQKRRGFLVDFGLFAEIESLMTFSILVKDVGKFYQGKDLSVNSLFVYRDHQPKAFYSVALTPETGFGDFQFGGQVFQFFERQNSLEKQWGVTADYFFGPLKILTGFKTGLLRTSLGLKYRHFEISLGQEWVNKVQDDRDKQARFTLEMSMGRL